MSAGNIFSRLFGGRKAIAKVPVPFQLYWTGGGFTMIPSNTASFVKDGYTGNSAVFSIVNSLTDKFISVPYYVYKVKNGAKMKQYSAATRHGYNSNAMLLKAQAMDELADNHPVSMLLDKPNSYQTEAEFWKMALTFKKLTGLGTIWANMGASGMKVQELHVLPTQWITLTPNEWLNDAKNVYFSPFGWQKANELEREQCYLWKYSNPDVDVTGQHLYGLSPLKAALKEVTASNHAARQMAKMYENGGARGVITPKEIITEEQVSGLRSAVEMWLTGSDNRGKVGGLGVPIDFHDIGLTAVDMALLEGKQLTDERIATVFNYPPALLRSDNKYDNANAAIKYLVTNSLYADFVSKRDMINQWLMPLVVGKGADQYYVDFDLSVVPELQADIDKMVSQASQMWWITPNEKRQLTTFDTLPDPAMDTVFMPSGFAPISEMMLPDEVDQTEDYADASTTAKDA